QAEDGIRAFHVTGVQTCALPIFAIGSHLAWRGDGVLAWVLLALQFLVYPQLVYLRARRAPRPGKAEIDNLIVDSLLFGAWVAARSEERRVGKECRYEWAGYR